MKKIFKSVEFYLAIFFFILISALYFYNYLEGLEMRFLDYRFQHRTYKKPENKIVLVEVTDDCLAYYGAWPWSRGIHAQLINFLEKSGAKLIVFDIFFSTPGADKKGDKLLEQSLKKSKNVVLAELFSNNDILDPETGEIKRGEVLLTPLAQFKDNSLSQGFINTDLKKLNNDGIIRKAVLFKKNNKKWIPSLSMATLQQLLNKKIKVQDNKTFFIGNKKYTLWEDHFWKKPPLQYYMVNYRGTAENGYFEMYPFSSVADGEIPAEEFKGKIVLVASQINDMRVCPLGTIPGVEVHASIISNFLNNDFIIRLHKPQNILLFFLFAILLSLFLGKIKPSKWDLIYISVFLGSIFYISLWSFKEYSFIVEFIPLTILLLTIWIFTRFYQLFIQLWLTNLSLIKANKSLDQKVRELSVLYNISQKTILTESLSELFDLILQEINTLTHAEASYFFLSNEKEKNFYLEKFVGETPYTKKITENYEKILEIKETSLNSPVFSEFYSVDKHTALSIPLIFKEKHIGFFLLILSRENQFLKEELSLLQTISNQLSVTIENYKLWQESVEKQKMEKELNLARKIQVQMLPKEAPKIKGLDIYGANYPARFVGGDYFDFFYHKDKDVLDILIGDVSGKGPSAALVVAMAKSVLYLQTQELLPLEVMLENLNDVLINSMTESLFITIWVARIDLKTGKTTYCCGGHNPTYLMHGAENQLEELRGKGTLVGILPFVNYKPETLQLKKGDVMILYTDGVNEAMDINNEQFDYPRFEECIKESYTKSSEEIYNHIYQAILDFRGEAAQSDDITMIILKVLDDFPEASKNSSKSEDKENSTSAEESKSA